MSDSITELRQWVGDYTTSDNEMAKALRWSAKQFEKFATRKIGPWGSADDPVKHGIIRAATHKLRHPAAKEPPCAALVLWRPWRVLRTPTSQETDHAE